MSETFETVLTMVETFVLALPRLEIYKQLFISSPRFCQVLQSLYYDLIEFCLAAVKLARTSSIKMYISLRDMLIQGLEINLSRSER